MKFTEEHEWLRPEGDLIVVGITEHASEQLGDVVFVELPEADTTVSKDDEVAVIESVKAASDILAPLDGEIVEVNEAIVANPGLVNEDPMGDAWFFKMKIEDASALDDFRDPKRPPDLDEFPPRDDHFASPGERVENEKQRCGVVDLPRSGPPAPHQDHRHNRSWQSELQPC